MYRDLSRQYRTIFLIYPWSGFSHWENHLLQDPVSRALESVISARTPSPSSWWRLVAIKVPFTHATLQPSVTPMAHLNYYSSGQWTAVQTSSWPDSGWETSQVANGPSPASSSVSRYHFPGKHVLTSKSLALQILLLKDIGNQWTLHIVVHPMCSIPELPSQLTLPITPITPRRRQLRTLQQQQRMIPTITKGT